MEIGRPSGHAPAGGSHEKALLDQVWLEHVFDGTTLLADGRRKALHADGTAIELFNHRQ